MADYDALASPGCRRDFALSAFAGTGEYPQGQWAADGDTPDEGRTCGSIRGRSRESSAGRAAGKCVDAEIVDVSAGGAGCHRGPGRRGRLYLSATSGNTAGGW